MTNHMKAAIAYAVLCVALIVIGFGPLEEWQMALRNAALMVTTLLILLIPAKQAAK